jgi:hypothetical protein
MKENLMELCLLALARDPQPVNQNAIPALQDILENASASTVTAVLHGNNPTLRSIATEMQQRRDSLQHKDEVVSRIRMFGDLWHSCPELRAFWTPRGGFPAYIKSADRVWEH